MSVSIKTVFECPRCEAGITSLADTTACPSCGLPLGKQSIAPYTPPFTLTEQHQKYIDEEQLLRTLSNLPPDKANSIMNDALLLIQSIAGKNNRTEDIRIMVTMAIQVGEIAKAYDEFLKTSGKHYPSFFAVLAEKQKQQQREKEEQEKRNVSTKRMVEVITGPASPHDGGSG